MGSDGSAHNCVPLRAVVWSSVTCARMPAHVGSWRHSAPTSFVPAIHEGRRKKFVTTLRAPTCGFLHYILSEQSICTSHIMLYLSRVLACSFSLTPDLDFSLARSLFSSLARSLLLSFSLTFSLSLSFIHTHMLGAIALLLMHSDSD